MALNNQTITVIEGIRVGHMQNMDALTGCTVVLCPPQTVGGVDQRGGAPGTRETDLLRPMHMVEYVDALVFSGGSAYGLDSASGVMTALENQGIGFDTGVGLVPIVPAAVIFDLGIGVSRIRPDATMGKLAVAHANSEPVTQGCTGAGTGATVGKLAGQQFACKSGIGSAAIELPGGVLIAALMVVNAVGDILDETGDILAGARTPPEGNSFVDSLNLLQEGAIVSPGTNTTIGVVATNASLSKSDTNKLAQMAQNGLARAIRPVHTMFDGDTVFALSTGTQGDGNVSVIGTFAAQVVEAAIRNAVLHATPAGGLPTATTMKQEH